MSAWKRKEVIGNATLYLGDALEILSGCEGGNSLAPNEARGLSAQDCEVRFLDGQTIDAVITDPPYGQACKVNTFYAGGTRENAVLQRNGKRLKVRPNVYPDIHGDDSPFDPSPWLDVAPVVLLWGAHKFAHRLPPGGWLVWDKVPTGKVRDQGDGEAAWINRDQPMRIFRLLWDGLCVGVGARHEVTAGQQRYHPAQKPEALMRWCIQQAGAAETILDPYMGAGSTGVAAAQMGRNFVGVEIEPRYFDIACQRIENAQRQERMFA